MKPELSIIMPIHNSEPYLRIALESLMTQSYRDFELICIDNKSTDESLSVLLEFSCNDNRIKIYNSDIGGAATARNIGISVALGDYIICLDSDDIFESHMLLHMIEPLKKYPEADICICNAYIMDSQSGRDEAQFETLRGHTSGLISSQDLGDSIFQISPWAPWNKMYRKSFIDKYGFRYQELQNSNDVFFGIAALSCSRFLYIVNEPLLHYRRGHSSVTDIKKSKNSNCGLLAADKIFEFVTTSPFYSYEMEKSLVKLCIQLAISSIEQSITADNNINESHRLFIVQAKKWSECYERANKCIPSSTRLKYYIYQNTSSPKLQAFGRGIVKGNCFERAISVIRCLL